MKTKRYIRTIIAMLMLLLYGAAEVWADVTAADIIIQVMPSASAGTVSVVDISDRVVTLTVTPASGYKIKKDLIVVEKMVNPGRSSAPRRAPGLGTFEVSGTTSWITSSQSGSYTFNIPEEYDGAYVTATFVSDEANLITSLEEITEANGHYKLARDINASGYAGFSSTFTGTFDGNGFTISNLGHALFNTVHGGVVKNVILDDVSISGGTNVGAIANEATGDSRIYNCGVLATGSIVEKDGDGYDKLISSSSSISGSGYVGSIVGLLDGSSRVINCFSYANVSGGTHAGGIVGYNNVATTASNLQTMVMNCMFYGEVSGSSIAPIYNGQIITNDGDADGVNNFNYFRLESAYIQNTALTKVYNCALGAETRFLQRFEFYRHLLNSNRELAAWWATGDAANKDEMMKWVLEPTQIGSSTPYPILKTPGKYPSVVNYDAKNAPTTSERNKGAKLGTLTVKIQMGSGAVYGAPTGASITKSNLSLDITDKDFDHFNFNYYKVQLPYYNDVGTGNYTENRVVTGWKIVSITGGTAGTYSTGGDVTYENGKLKSTPYNFADRKCTNKDLYGTNGSNRVFNQGAYWDVPEGVTDITIEPYWGKAVYLSDQYWDVTYKNGSGGGTKEGTAYDAMTTAVNVTTVGGGPHSETFNGQIVFTSIGDAISSSGNGLFSGVSGSTGHTVYDYAVVLVGNYHHTTTPNADNGKPYTVTSVDQDGDNEPDYSLMLRFNGRLGFHPVRYDFLNMIGLGMAQKTTGGKGSYNLGIMQPKAWFEVTNTALFRVTQFEYSKSRTKKPYILQGGVIEQWVTQQDNAGDGVEYFHIGGNVWFKEFHRGSHQDNANKSTPHPPVSVTGGDYNKFYLTGLYQSQATIYDDNAECYINGGRFGEVAGAGMEGIGVSEGKGNITWVIDNADIREFYGGGINAAKPVHGNIHTIISNSHVDVFCGGPKFGDMATGRTVTTTATGCTFGTYFGAGYGGNSYNRYAPTNKNNVTNIGWNTWVTSEYKKSYNSTYQGVSTQIDYQFIPMSSNTDNVARLWVEFVKFSLATTRNVTSNLEGCTITGNFYGGGSLGKVEGDVTSTLDGCTVNGSVYGAGYSASLPTVEVMDIGFETEPYYYEDLGTYRKGVFPQTTTYTWENRSTVGVDNSNHILYTTENLSELGTVSGNVTLNVTGNSLIEGKIFDKNGNVTGQTGGVFGGGDESKVTGADKTVTVNINQTGTTVGHYINNVFGGGNEGDVASAVQVTVEGVSEILNDVYGGGNLADVSGKVTVNIEGGIVGRDVYGGGALANTNIGNATDYGTDSETISSTETKTTEVNITGGTVRGNVYGGGLGDATHAAKVYGDVVVNIGAAPVAPATTPTGSATLLGSVFGCNNLNGTPKGDVVVNIYKTAHTKTEINNKYPSGITTLEGLNSLSNDDSRFAIKAVYGGGNLAHYTPIAKTGDPHSTTVHVFGCTENTIKTVYGGGNAANVGTTGEGGVPANTNVIIEGGRFDTVFGGGNGYSETNNHSDPTAANYNPGANIYGTATTDIQGGLFNQVFGGSNQYGDVTATDLRIEKICDDLLIKESFGGANEADITGDVTTTLACSTNPPEIGTFYGGSNKANITGNVTLNVEGGKYTDIFGGSKGTLPPANATDEQKAAASADISGNVTLNLYGGTMDNAFGGSDVNGLIGGKITVNMLDGGSCELVVNNIYGGGRDAAYTPTTPGSYPEVNLIHGTVSKKAVTNGDNTTYTGGNVFGGGKGAGATVTSNPTVYVGYNSSMSPLVTSLLPENTQFNTANVSVEGNVYGGGDLAAVTGSTSVTLQQHTAEGFTSGSTVSGDMYGGGNQADVTGSVTVTLTGGSVTGDVYGGGALANTNTDQTNIGTDEAPAHHSTTVTIAGGTVSGNIYGGGLGRNEVEAVDDNPATPEDETVVHVEPVAALVYGAVTVTVNGGTVADVFGCNNFNGAPQSTVEVNINNNVGGSVYGGGNLAAYSGSPAVNINDGTVSGSVYGGGKGSTAVVTGNPVVTVGDNTTADTYAVVSGNVYGGGDAAAVTGNTTVTYNDNNASSTVAKLFGGGNAAGVSGTSTVTLTSGKVTNGVYGGCNASGTIGGDATVTLNGGQVGTSEAHADVFGGGYGNATYVKGNVTVNVGTSTTTTTEETTTTTYSGTTTIYGDVYGGGAQGHVNAEENETPSATEPTKTTTVNLYKGTIHGDVYGGGLGDATHAAYVGGSVNVNLYETVFDITTTTSGDITYANSGRIFGGNNEKGTPKGHITVHVFNTETSTNTSFGYELAAVFGGGNKADYEPTKATDYAEVIIEGCNNTSIKDVYGGGNAAAVPATEVWILGSSIIENVFGGGNGELGPAHAAHVGVHRASASTTSPYPTGTTGKTYVYLIGGTITNVYGGSNSNGDIIGGSNIQMPTVSVYTESHPGAPTPSSCTLHTTNIYGGGKNADMSGGANIALGCMPDAWIDEIYAGAQAADIAGNVSLTITSGKFQRVFGGNKDSGMLKGSITVNIEETGECDVPIVIGELYAGGNFADYSIYGYDDSGNAIQKEEDKATGAPYDNPKLNVRAFTSIGAIYGGGYSALMVGSPTIDINVVKGSHADDETLHNGTGNTFPAGETEGVTSESTLSLRYPAHTKGEIGAIGNVYGGGNLANVIGNTAINIGTATSVGFVTEPIHLRPNSSTPLQQTNGFYVVDVQGANITENVYGGGNDADIVGNTTITIGTVNLTGTDKFGTNVGADVYGGGKGQNTTVTGDVAVNIGTNASGTAVGYGIIGGDVYGGSALGAVNATCTKDGSGNVTAYAASSGKTTQVNLYGGTVTGNLFGGGLGQTSPSDIVAKNYGNTAVKMEGGTVGVAVYGGANANGVLKGDSKVTITGGTVGTDPGEGDIQNIVFGGGKGQPTLVEGSVEVNIGTMTTGETPAPTGNATIWGNVYGGSALGNVNAYLTGSPAALTASSGKKTDVKLYGGTIHGDLFGGGLGQIAAAGPPAVLAVAANVYGPVVVTTKGGTATNVFGSNNLYGAPQNTVRVNIDGGEFSGSVYGGGNLAAYSANQTLTVAMSGGTVTNDVFGGGLGTSAQVTGNTSVTVSGGTVSHDVYGGGSEAEVVGGTSVTLSGTGAVDNDVYGGGKMANVTGAVTVALNGGTVGRDVYGGGALARTNTSYDAESSPADTYVTSVTLAGADVTGDVYGGGLGTLGVSGSAEVPAVLYADAEEYNAAKGTSWTSDQFAALTDEEKTKTPAVAAVAEVPAVAANVNGPVTVAVTSGTAVNVFGCNNLNGAPQTTVAVNIGGGEISGSVYGGGNQAAYSANETLTVAMSGGEVRNDVFGGGLGMSAQVTGNTSVTVSGGTVTHDVYGGGSQAKVSGSTSVTISETARVNNDVFGGGKEADVTRNVTVTISGGTVTNDVYGGGALANTNTDNWDFAADKYVDVTDKLSNGVSLVTGLYTESGGTYTPITTPDTRADGSTKYYQKGDWNTGHNEYNSTTQKYETTYMTTVNLTGGIVGNAYGGGLGRQPVEAVAYEAATTYSAETAAAYNAELAGAIGAGAVLSGDKLAAINGLTGKSKTYTVGEAILEVDANLYNSILTGAVKVGDPKPAVEAVDAAPGKEANVYGDVTVHVNGTAFTHSFVTPTDKAGTAIPDVLDVPLTGRVFGCNNLYGTPKGNVLVQVDRTRRIMDDGTITDDHQENIFEIHSVYGGGNLSTYQPSLSTAKGTKVIINGCEDTSIEKVFGGGNSASVPSTDVLILGTYYVGYAFSGGNGADMYQKNNRWLVNNGAPIYGDATIIAIGGKIGQVFGGSDTKGHVYGTTTTKLKGKKGEDNVIYDGSEYSSECALKITNAYGAGRGAGNDGDVNFIVSGCTAGDEIERVFGGSYDADIRGSITLTITGGIFSQVIGGNDHGGNIGGEITVNIEETQPECIPIIIQYLYGGCREADYPGDNARYITNLKNAEGDYIGDLNYHAFPDAANEKNAKITVNIKSATRIDHVYGGSYRAKVNGDTEVNINMIRGRYAGSEFTLPTGYRGNPIPNSNMNVTYVAISSEDIKVDETEVDGYYTYDDETHEYTQLPQGATAEDGVTYYQQKPTGSITIDKAIGTIGNVYGGCFEGEVNGSATINIGTEDHVLVLKRNGEGTIVDAAGNAIYDAAGKLNKGATVAYVEPDDTNVTLGAHITGNVYGGGDQAKVTGNTVVNIGAKYDEEEGKEGKYVIVPEGADKVTIAGTDYPYGVFGGGNKGEVDGDSYVYLGAGSVGESVYGGGCEADVKGNTHVTMLGGYVFDGVYGGGLKGSVGTITEREALPSGHPTHEGCLLGKPKTFADNTGKCTVVVSGGQVGPVEVAKTDGGMKNTARYFKETGDPDGPVDVGFVFGAGRGEVMSYEDNPDADFLTYVKETDVTISDDAFIMASVYGGGENGRVRGNTLVKIQGGQIGCGEGKVQDGKPVRYTSEWEGENPENFTECSSWDYGEDTNNDGTIDHYNCLPHDPLANMKYSDGSDAIDGSTKASDGHTYYGNVFGGGSGYYPYEYIEGGVQKHDWLRSAGWVEGDTKVIITGGHILTSVYGGNELTDVGGTCQVIMTGGTLGVPRTDADAQAHPVTCYLFGAGKGDQRVHFNTWTNVQNTEVYVSGSARIFGSVFGGGEDGHILGNAEVNIGNVSIDLNGDGDTTDEGETFTASSTLKIGTTGTSYVDGNVFGGGRGFSGTALTAGSVGGNINVNISGGTMLGSVYGGGRLASVGIPFTAPTDPAYGQLIPDGKKQLHPSSGSYELVDETDAKHGHITVTISGDAKIGTTTETGTEHSVGGNIFGGCMGRIDLLDGSRNPLWPKMAVAKKTTVTIEGTPVIMNNVYGGSEFGIVRDRATVDIKGGTIHGNVFGGGYGHDDETPKTINIGQYTSPEGETEDLYVTFTPLQWTGCVSGDTEVNVSGGTVKKNVYGGGNLASVGLINYYSDKDGNYRYVTKHESVEDGFALSWPCQFTYIGYDPDKQDVIGGKATVNITGGTIGQPGNTDTGFVFGGSKGKAMERYREAHLANARETKVTIESSPTIYGSVYGGGQDGHVIENAAVAIKGGIIEQNVFGGGEGEGTYSGTLKTFTTDSETGVQTATGSSVTTALPSWTAGKVYGNTSVTMSAGTVKGNVYGGGNLASVGKGNYASGEDDYYPDGYGEKINGIMWTPSEGFNPSAPITSTHKPTTMADHFLSSGKATVTITGGKVGTKNGISGTIFGTSEVTPTGMVFGGCRGRAAQDVVLNPRYEYAPNFYLGYVNETVVTIGTENATGIPGETAGVPRIYSQVFGGGRDGHVRGSTHVIINNGEIGQSYDDTEGGESSTKEYQLYHRGNVYGSGSGLGTWDGGTRHGMSSGSVTRNTTVDINGGTIHNNVYGGGALSCVGPPKITSQDYAPATWSKCTVNINGGTIGTEDCEDHGYGGDVYGASRGRDFATYTENDTEKQESPDDFATTLWNDVNIYGGSIAGNVYGGGQASRVKRDNKVSLKGGSIGHDAYGGGRGTSAVAADVGGNVTVELNKDVASDAKGCTVRRIFGCNDLNGTPRGNVTVHVYATQNKYKKGADNKQTINEKYEKFNNLTGYSITKYDELITLATTYSISSTYSTDIATLEGSGDNATKEAALKRIIFAVERAELESYASTLGIDISSYKATLDGGSASDKEKALAGMREVVANKKYDVEAVYGGGDLALYQPYGPSANGTDEDYKNTTKKTQVIIEGCDLTSIKHVYGSGNAASTPACAVTVNSAYEIDELFGGGNGNDSYEIDGVYYENPGANVGYYNYTHYVKLGETGYDASTHGTGTAAAPYKAIENDDAKNKDLRQGHYKYGLGTATTNIYGGRIHNVYGGSNKKGNISTIALSTYESGSDCALIIDNSYGAGKDAEIDGEARVNLGCVDYMARLVGGATNADVNSDVNLVVTNGNYGQVFGGNDTKGHVYGAITVTIKESSCKPIFIGELYATGYGIDAPYSIYGYYDTGETDSDGKAIYEPRTKEKFEEDREAAIGGETDPDKQNEALMAAGLYGFPKRDPRILVVSASRIDEIYGGGYQALTIGSPHINVNMEKGKVTAKYVDGDYNTGGAYEPNMWHESTDKQGNPYKDKENNTYKYWVDDVDDSGDAILKIGTIGQIFGGGNMADVQGNTYVEIGTGKWINHVGKWETEDASSTYTYEDRSDANEANWKSQWNEVTTTGNWKWYDKDNQEVTPGPARNAAFITGSVYGGGKMGNVGEYTVADEAYNTAHPSATLPIGKPYECVFGGKCYVTISNGEIGPNNMNMWHVDSSGNIPADDKPDDKGHVFGGGQGNSLPDYDNAVFSDYAEVTVNGNAWVKGSVYGGSENGHVLHDTHVTIDGNCQIGAGHILMKDEEGKIKVNRSIDRPYTETEWLNGRLSVESDDFSDLTSDEKSAISAQYAASLPECASWPYETPYAPHDKFANATGELEEYADNTSTNGGRRVASDGHTFYGNVFGGGSGYYPYAAGEWNHKAGWVEGNTLVEIKGGHILTNIYGGNELTNVGDGLTDGKGKCTVRMSGGTLGVPRTLEQIAAHPVTCYLFGAGKGDQIVKFNTETNVREVKVDVSGGWIYGSVFGGGEDGHVLGDVALTVSGGKIGTWGTSYVDGNIFGGGRGFSGDALTAGVVCGNVDMNISGGTMLGSIYGGGRLGSVGTHLVAPEKEEMYGVMIPDGKLERIDEAEDVVAEGVTHGHVTINITGGTIGNPQEFQYVPTDVTTDAMTAWKTEHHVPQTTYESTSKTTGEATTYTHRLSHTKGGNVYAGGMGRRKDLNGNVISEWTKLGNVKSTKLTIGGTAWIMGNVYGGGEFGAVTGNHQLYDGSTPLVDAESNPIVSGTEIIITGGTIGTEITSSTPVKDNIDVPGSYPEGKENSDVKYTFGSVFGGGYGTKDEIEEIDANEKVNQLGALVEGNTNISMSSGHVRASVYGGGELAAVGGNTKVTISGGKIGRDEVKAKGSDDDDPGYVMFGGMTMGNVYGGGKGDDSHTLVGVVKGNTNVTINAGATEGEPFIYHNVYGGGAYGSVGTFIFSDGVGNKEGFEHMKFIPKGIPLEWTANTGVATVNIKGGTIGISGCDNGMVNGSSRGDVAKPIPTIMGGPNTYTPKDPYDKMAWVERSIVNIGETGTTGPHIKGSVYGGGENGHVFTHATVNVKSGTIGIVPKTGETQDPWLDFGTPTINEKAWITRGNVYGAGCGTDTYTGDDKKEHYNEWAGCVIGNTDVNISGGLIAQSVYGGGSMGSVGRILEDPQSLVKHEDTTKEFALSWPYKFTYRNLSDGTPTGKTTVNITGGRIGTTGSDNGDVFGGSRGEAGPRYDMAKLANVRETEVNIDYTSTPTDNDALAIVENIEDGKAKFSLRVKDDDVEAITGSVYGGAENGHVNEDTKVTITNGLIGHAVYGGGKGKGKYEVELINWKDSRITEETLLAWRGKPLSEILDEYKHPVPIYSVTAGRVFGNTTIDMQGGHVMRNIYGGGNMGSVGKGNYAGGKDDYSYYAIPGLLFSGYGETLDGNLWDNVSDNSKAFLASGKTNVSITGGTVGFMVTPSTDVIPLEGAATTFNDYEDKAKLVKVLSKDDLPTGNIFGGCRGEAPPNVSNNLSPRYYYCPEFYAGYVNETDVEIGDATADATGGPRIYGSVYGGGQDGHVRRSTNVTINKGEIGIPYNTDYQDLLGITDLDNPQWLHRGNVYGSGSGIGKYTDKDASGQEIEFFSTSSGSVTGSTTVTVNNGITGEAGSTTEGVYTPGNVIYRNVYGGGSLASVGPPKIPASRPDDALLRDDSEEGKSTIGKQSTNTVAISGTVGAINGYNEMYGGEVYGGSRGEPLNHESYPNFAEFATSVWTKVHIKDGAYVKGNVFGGGDSGKVKKDTDVKIGGK